MRKEKIDEWIKESDDKMLNICHSMEEITNEKGETVEMMSERMKKNIHKLQDSVGVQKRKWEENTTQLTENIEKELNKLHSELETQRKTRDNTRKKIVQMAQ